MTKVRAAARVLAALTVACTALPVLAAPAGASCGGAGFDEELALGSAIAIVTRTDPGPGNKATFRVERSYGVDLPPTLTAEVSGGMDSRPAIFKGQTAAVTFRRMGDWTLLPCSDEQVGEVLSRFDGEPRVSSAGPAVALAIGYFGGANLVALDRNGRPVTWNRSEGYSYKLTMCPGGRTAVVVASAGETTGDGQEISVYAVDGLRLLRTVRLDSENPQDDAMAMRCADADGSTIQLLMHRRETPVDAVALLTVDGRRVSTVPVSIPLRGGEGNAQAVPDGFLLSWGERKELTRINLDGTMTTLIPGRSEGRFYEYAVAHDGQTIAVHASGSSGAEMQVLELGTGNVLARRPLTEAFGFMRWDEAGRLLVRTGFDQGWSKKPTRGHILVLDRALKEVAKLVGPWSDGAAPVGDRFIAFGRTRLGVMTAEGAFEESPELRLVATGAVVAIPGAPSADPLELPTVAEFVTAEGGESTDDPAVAILLGLGLVALSAGAAGLRRPRAS